MATGGRFLIAALAFMLTAVALQGVASASDLPVQPPDTEVPPPPVTLGRCVAILDGFGESLALNGARDIALRAFNHQSGEAVGFANAAAGALAPDSLGEDIIAAYLGLVNSVNYTLQNVSQVPLVVAGGAAPAVEHLIVGSAGVSAALLKMGPNQLNSTVPWAGEAYQSVAKPVFDFEDGLHADDLADPERRSEILMWPVGYAMHVLGTPPPPMGPVNEGLAEASSNSGFALSGAQALGRATLDTAGFAAGAVLALTDLRVPVLGDPTETVAFLQSEGQARAGSMTAYAQSDATALATSLQASATAAAAQTNGLGDRVVNCPDIST